MVYVAKMKLSEALKKIFGDSLDKEIDLDEETSKKEEETSKEKSTDGKKEEDKRELDDKAESNDEQKKKEDGQEEKLEDTSNEKEVDSQSKIFEMNWLKEDGSIDYNKIGNEEVRKAVEMLENRYTSEKNARLISDSIDKELDNCGLSVSKETMKKVLDMNNVKINEKGEVTGIKEQLDDLRKSDSALFIDKSKESNPLNEGFNPVHQKEQSNVNSISEAFSLMDEME